MTTITERNAKALADRNGTTIPEAPKPTKKAQAKATPETKAPATPKETPKPVQCHCGCGDEAKVGRSYLPGHDARHAGEVGRALAAKAPGAEDALKALPPKLAEKAQRFADNRAKEADRKAQAKAIRDQAAKDLKAALAAL